jgi:methionine sulfoxide reductase catalytic subunit
MLIKRPSDFRSSEITPKDVFHNRREFLREAVAAGVIATGGLILPRAAQAAPQKLGPLKKTPYSIDEKLTTYANVTNYNNFYEFGTDKGDPARHAHRLKPRPWTVRIAGEAKKTGVVDIDDLIRPHALEERVYRLRCVEAWSMVIPWVGIPLAEVIKRFEPTSRAKFVQFETKHDPEQMPGQSGFFGGAGLEWPYVEGLRMDEAMHPLTILAVGLYGEVLPNQNGAPIRLVVPWKYGFKSIKSIVTISFTQSQPVNTWYKTAPREYGFYSNVNPQVDHPRWSQAQERRIGEDGLFSRKRPTLMFNGYAEQVASLYADMDLRKNF